MKPSFTTKAKSKGGGLGLVMVHGFAKQPAGSVKIHSEVGHGTTFRMFPAPAPSPRRRRRAPQTVMREDRPDMTDTAAIMTRDFSLKVLVANGPMKAIEIPDGQTRIDLSSPTSSCSAA